MFFMLNAARYELSTAHLKYRAENKTVLAFKLSDKNANNYCSLEVKILAPWSST